MAIDPRQGLWIDFVTGRRKLKEMPDNEKKVLYEYGLEKGHIEYDRIPETTRSVLGLKAVQKTQDTSMPSPAPAKQEDKDNTFLQAIDNVIKSRQLKAPLDIWQPQRDRVPSVGIRDITGQSDLDKIFEPKLPPQVGVEKKQPLEIWQPMRDRAPLGGQMPKTMPQMGLTGNISLWEPMRDVPQGKERSMGTKLEADYFERGDQPSIAKTVGKSLLAAGANLSQNIANIPRMIAKGGAKLLDFLTPDKIYKEEEDPYVKFFDKVVGGYEEVTQKHIEDLGELKGVRKDLSGVMLNLPQIAFSAFMGYATGGMSTTAKLGDVSRMLAQQSKWLSPEVARMIPFGATAGSGYAREAELEGANYLEQVAYGVIGGLGEMATEMPVVTGWINIIDKVTGGLGRAGAANLMQLYGQVGIDWLKNILAEAVQEAAMEPITAMARTLYADDVTLYGKGGIIDIKGMAEAARGGAAMSIVLGALGLPMSTAANRYVTSKIEKNEPMTEQDLTNVVELIKKDLEQQEPAKTGLTEKDIMDLATEVAKPFTEPGPVTPKPAQTTVQKPPASPITAKPESVTKPQSGLKKGEVGGKMKEGEVRLTATGRETTPFPRIDMSTARKADATMKRVDNWLIDNAIAEAKARGDKFNLVQFENINRKNITKSDKDGAEIYLFGDVVPEAEGMPVEKPATDEGIISPEGQIEALKQDTDKMISRFIDKVIAMSKRNSEKSGYEYTAEREKADRERLAEQGKQLIEAIDKRDFDYLHNVLFTSNKASIGLFSEYTGLPVGTNKEIDQSIASLDPEAYKKYEADKKKAAKKRREAEEQKALEAEIGTKPSGASGQQQALSSLSDEELQALRDKLPKYKNDMTPEQAAQADDIYQEQLRRYKDDVKKYNKAWKKITTLEDTLERYDIDAKEKARIIDTYKRLTEGAKQAGVNVNLIVNLADKITANITDTMLKEHGLKPGTDAYIAGKTEMHKDGEIFNIVITLLADRNAPITQEIIHEFAEVWATVWEHGKPAEYGRAIDFLVKRGLSKERAREFLPEIFTDYALNEELIGDMINEDQAAKTLFSKTLDSFKNWLQTVLKRLSYFRSQVLRKLPDEIKNQARLFANGKWKEAFESIKDVQHIDDTTRYAVRTRPAPKKTIKVYKLMRVMETQKGKVFPLFVDAAQPAPIGVWLDAEEGPITINEKTGIPKVTSRLGKLAYRPGWHLTDIPIANHIGVKGKSGKIEYMNQQHVWCECEVAADVDYQPEANANGRDPKTGRVIPSKADIKRIPVDGYYRFKTNPNMAEDWIITGAIKINRVLSDAEVEQILIEHGQKPMPRQGGPIDLKKYGLDKDQLMYSIKAEGIDPILETYKKVFGEKPVTATTGEIVIKPEDIDYERARRAYSNISMDPERRAISTQQDYVTTMNSIYNRLSALAKTDEQKRILTEEFKKFQQGYIQRYNALLDAKSRTASPMITGPSNFPVERNRKRMEIEDRRREELLDYGKRQPERIEKLLKSKDTEENKFNAFWQDIASSIGVIKGIDAGTEPYNRALFVSSIKGKIERAFNRGDTETAIKALKKIKEIQASMTKPVFTSRHSIWKLLEKEAIPLAEKHKPEVTEVTGEHGVAHINDNDKVVLSFDKEYYMSLSDELKKEIKSNFLFSRKSSAWISRGYWRNKAYAYEKILKKHGLSLAAAKAQEQLTPEETTKQPGPTEITNIEKDGITIDEHRRAFDKNGNLIFSPKGRDRLSAEKMDAALEQFKKDYNRFEKGLTYITGKTKYIFKGVTPSGDWQFEEVDTGRMEYVPYDRLLAYDFTEAESETKPQEELKEISSGEPLAKPQEELRTVPKQVAPSETNVQPKQPSAIYRYYITMDPEIRGDAIPDAKNVVLYDKVDIDSKYGKVYGFVDLERPASQASIIKYGLRAASRPANEAILEQLIIDGELDEDNIIIPRAKYLGYTKEMKEFIAQELIDGSKTDEKYISFKVPGDGKFTVVNRPDAIARLLNGLNIKAQVAALPSNIKKAIDGETVAYCSINGITYFIPESKKAYFIAMPDKDFAAVKNYASASQSLPAKKRITLTDIGSRMRGIIKDFLSSDMVPANGKVYAVKKFRNKIDVYLFEHNGLYYIFGKKYVDLFNEKGNKMYLSTLKTKKGDAARLMITNSEGQIIGGINSLFETITEEEVSSEDLSAIPATVKWNTKHNDPYKPSALENQTDAITGLKNDLLTTGVAHNEGRTAKITADFIDENREKRVYNIDITEDGQRSVLLNKDIADHDEAINRAIDYLIHGKPAEKATETKKPMPEEREKPPRIKETNRLTLPVEKLAADYKARGMDKYRAWDQFIIDRALKPEIDAREFYQIFEEVSPNLIRDGFTGEIVPTHIIKHVGGLK